MRAAERLIPAPRHGPRMPPPARIGRNRERTVRGWGSGGVRVAVLQAQDPAGRAAEQPSRHYQRRGGDRVGPVRRPGRPRTRGPAAGLSETSGCNPPADLDRRPEAWLGDAASGEPEARWIEAKRSRPHRRGAASPYCGRPAPRLAPRRRRFKRQRTAAKPRGHGPGRSFRAPTSWRPGLRRRTVHSLGCTGRVRSLPRWGRRSTPARCRRRPASCR